MGAEEGGCYTPDVISAFKNAIETKLQANKKVALWTHAYPDPDAIGSMMGMSWLLLNGFGLHSDCFYSGMVAHPQNNAICNLLDPQLLKTSEYDPKEYCMNILLDTIPINAGVGEHKIDFDIVIDHHKEVPNGGFRGYYLNMKAGSCCGTVFPLMKLSKRWLEHDNEHDKKIATALIAGIVTDTEYLLSDDTTEYEFNAYQGLFEYRNHNFLKEIVFFKRPKFWIDVKAKASTAARIDSEGYAIVGMGILPDKDRDLIADMADEMIQWVGVETAIAFAVVGGVKVEGSVRSDNASLSVSEFCKKLGGTHGTGGGKHGKGAYRYGLGNLELDPDEPEDSRVKTWELIKDKEYHRIQRMIKR